MPVKKGTVKKAVGLGVLAAAAVAAGFYFYGKNGKQNRQKVGTWVEKAKADVTRELKKLTKINRAAYNRVVSEVTKKYQGLKGVDKSELVAMASDLKAHWKNIESQFKKAEKESAVRTKKKRTK